MKNNNAGNISITMCFILIALFGFAAYVIDIGIVYAEKQKLSNAIDSAALSAALELPDNKQKAIQIASEYLEKNNVSINNALISVSEDKKSIQVEAYKNVNHFLAPLIRKFSSRVDSKTKAIIGPAKSISNGIRPFAVKYFNYTYGDIVTLKENAGDAYQGNFGVVALGGTGASVFLKNALYGYDGKISVGDYINTETGNMAGVCNNIKNYIKSEESSFNNFNRDSIRLWTIPLVSSLDVDGRKPVEVIGFAQFYIEDINQRSGQIEIQGRFLKYVKNAEIDTSLYDTGLYGVKLSK